MHMVLWLFKACLLLLLALAIGRGRTSTSDKTSELHGGFDISWVLNSLTTSYGRMLSRHQGWWRLSRCTTNLSLQMINLLTRQQDCHKYCTALISFPVQCFLFGVRREGYYMYHYWNLRWLLLNQCSDDQFPVSGDEKPLKVQPVCHFTRVDWKHATLLEPDIMFTAV